jgi:hypothetical protein
MATLPTPNPNAGPHSARPAPRRLAAAAAASLVLHVGVLLILLRAGGAYHPGPQEAAPVIFARLKDPPPAAATPAAEPVAAAATPLPPQAAVPAPVPSAAPARPAPSPIPAPASSPAETVDNAKAPANSAESRPPQALSNPGLAGVMIRNDGVVARLRVGPEGDLQQVEWARSEVPRASLEALGKALALVRFTPALRDGKPVEAEVVVRFCFDADGALAANAPGCWDPVRMR